MKPSLPLNENLLDKSLSYGVAVSFGPDSMALLSMLLQAGYQLHVAHVNYHQRKESDLEQSQLEQFCFLHHLPLSVLDVNPNQIPKGNFQHEARTIRYDFFLKLSQELNLSAFLTAHHADDDIETFFMQQSRRTLHEYYGMDEKSSWKGLTILRPLLQSFKSDLVGFCNQKNIPFAIDASNAKPIYTRNRIRQETLMWSIQKKRDVLKKKLQLNKQTEKAKTKLQPFLNQPHMTIRTYTKWSQETQFLYWVETMKRLGFHHAISEGFLKSVEQILQSKQATHLKQLSEGWYFEKSYEEFRLIHASALRSYRIQSSEQSFVHPRIQFHFETLQKKFGHVLIRSAQPNDRLKIKAYKKTFRRLAIDWKMPLSLRKVWPVVTSLAGNILTIPRYQKTPIYQDNQWFDIRK